MSNDKVRLIPGAGVEIEKFVKKNQRVDPPVVMLPARLLWSKGVGEFVQVARELRDIYPTTRFLLVGDCDDQNPESINEQQLEQWLDEGVVEHISRAP